MASITLVVNNKGFISFKTNDVHLKLVGEFLTLDVGYMPEFARALLSSPFAEHCQLQACVINTNDTTIIISSATRPDDQSIALAKNSLLHIIQTWESIVIKEKKKFFMKELQWHDLDYTILTNKKNLQDDSPRVNT